MDTIITINEVTFCLHPYLLWSMCAWSSTIYGLFANTLSKPYNASHVPKAPFMDGKEWWWRESSMPSLPHAHSACPTIQDQMQSMPELLTPSILGRCLILLLWQRMNKQSLTQHSHVAKTTTCWWSTSNALASWPSMHVSTTLLKCRTIPPSKVGMPGWPWCQSSTNSWVYTGSQPPPR